MKKDKDQQMPGKALMYRTATKDSPKFECPSCKRQLSRGIIYEYSNSVYCSRNCFKHLITAQS